MEIDEERLKRHLQILRGDICTVQTYLTGNNPQKALEHLFEVARQLNKICDDEGNLKPEFKIQKKPN
jgi:hypothetical protein